MKPSTQRRRTTVHLGLILLALFVAVPAVAQAPRLPPVPEAPETGWLRQPFFEVLAPWNLDAVLFPPASRSLPPKPGGSADAAWELARKADAKRVAAEGKANDPFLHEEAARLFMQAYTADKNGAVGFHALRMAGRCYFLGKHWTEAAAVATTLVRKSGGRGADLPWYLLKGEALYQKRDLLAARECFRRAAAGSFDPDTKMRIDLRTADASLELGNVAYAEPAYRKALSGLPSPRKMPYNAIRFGEAMLAAEKYSEAAALFRSIDADPALPDLSRALASIGAGDAALLSADLPTARNAYLRAERTGEFAETKDLIKLRMADLAFAGGNRAEAAAGYEALAASGRPDIAREAGYKKALAVYVQGDYPGVLKVSEAWLAKYSGKTGDRGMRILAAKAAAEMVRAAGKANPADKWPALSSLLFAVGRTKEWPILMGEIGGEWENARIWGGAADLYAVAGDNGRSASMRRIRKAEAAYYRGELPAVLTELDWKGPQKEYHPGALWLAAKTFFRLDRLAEADAALKRLAVVQAELPPPPGEKNPFPPEKELTIFNHALQGRWAELREMFKELPPATGQVPGLQVVKAMSGFVDPKDAKEGTKGTKKAARGPKPATDGDIYAAYLRTRERVAAINAEDDPK
jgi:tetratricopeptide (TPR) repeat protein